MAVKKKIKGKKKLSAKKVQRGTVGNFFVFGMLALLIVLGITAVGGLPSQTAPPSGQEVLAITPTQSANHSNLQLKWFGYITLTPTPKPNAIHSCQPSQGVLLNTEREILQGSDPGPAGTVNGTGTVRVWVKDEAPLHISPHEKVNASTGVVTPGTQTALDQGTDGKGDFFWEPTLYIVPVSQPLNANHIYCDAKTAACTPHYPSIIKGDYNPVGSKSGTGPTVDSDANYLNGPYPNGGNPNGSKSDKYLAEFIWNISSFNLSSGTYTAEFAIHDGDDNLAIDCFTISF